MFRTLFVAFSFLSALPVWGLEVKVQDHKINALVYQQRSSEYRALCHQAFNLAKRTLDASLQNPLMGTSKKAVVVDVDETTLSNAPYEAALIIKGESYPKNHQEWIDAGVGPAVPGAVEFLNYASQKGVRVFYVTNRKKSHIEGTKENLKREGFPDVSDETLLVKEDTNSKEKRRELIRKNYEIVLLIGDNLIDVAKEFELPESEARHQAVEKAKLRFGYDFIVLPNAVYGEWETVFGNLNGLTEEEKRAAKVKALIPYAP